MTRKPGPEEGPGLFDLPLDAGTARRQAAAPATPEEPPAETATAPSADRPDGAAQARRGPAAATLGACLGAGLLDLGVTLAVALAMALGLRAMGVALGWSQAPAATVFLLAFSFLYLVTPLAFWGRTPGMAWAGLVARDADGGPLTFRQTAIRWLAAVATTAGLGLPLLLVLGGGSLSDRLSGSRTYRVR